MTDRWNLEEVLVEIFHSNRATQENNLLILIDGNLEVSILLIYYVIHLDMLIVRVLLWVFCLSICDYIVAVMSLMTIIKRDDPFWARQSGLTVWVF